MVKATKPIKGIKKDIIAKEKCHFYDMEGHWKHNYMTYLVSLKEKKHTNASMLGMYMIEMYSSIIFYSTWVLDTDCRSHICINM